MKQRTFPFRDSYDAVKFLDETRESQDYKDAKSVLVNIFTGRIETNYIAYIKELVESKLEKALISGLTCQTGFAHGERLVDETVLTILFFKDSEVQVIEYDFEKISEEDAERDFIERIRGIDDLRGIQAHTTPLEEHCNAQISLSSRRG